MPRWPLLALAVPIPLLSHAQLLQLCLKRTAYHSGRRGKGPNPSETKSGAPLLSLLNRHESASTKGAPSGPTVLPCLNSVHKSASEVWSDSPNNSLLQSDLGGRTSTFCNTLLVL